MIESKLAGIETAANYKGGPLPNSEWRVVDKLLADQFLEKNTNNRKLRQMQTGKFIRDIENGDREITHQGIGFDVNGVLIDGQHTLQSISDSGKPLYLLITYNLPVRAQLVVDSGASRTNYDRVFLSGKSGSKTDVAIARILCGNRRPTPMEVVHSFETHKDRIDLANSLFPEGNRKYIAIAPVMAVIVRATYHVERSLLTRFCEILINSSPDQNKPGEVAVLKLRDFLIRGKHSGTESYYDEVRDRTRYALRHFLEGKAMGQLRREEVEIFPLPNEVKPE